MNYRSRHLEQKVNEYSQHFRVVLITGARQVGKSSLLKALFPEHANVVFDPVQDIYNARKDPDLFLNNFPAPLILDEIQYVPELIPAIKRRVDQVDLPGQYILTGSQNLLVLRQVSESMAGRVGIIRLDGMTLSEMAGYGNDPENWLSRWLECDTVSLEQVRLQPSISIAQTLWRGTMPGLLDAPDSIVPAHFQSYVMTYLERDIRYLENIRDLTEFNRFMRLAAAFTAQEINASQFGRDTGITPQTARRWLDLLIHGYQWIELPPYHGNSIKRLTQKRKGYYTDTGLSTYLMSVSSPQALASHPQFGAVFETFCVNQLIRQTVRMAVTPMLYHWRTNAGAEVDVVLELNGKLYPVEIKSKTQLSGNDCKGIRAFLSEYPKLTDMGVIMYAGDRVWQISDQLVAIPWTAI